MEKLKQLREERGLSQVKLAARADLNPATVNQIERGMRDASPGTLRKLADALEVNLYDLLEEEPPKAQAPLWSDNTPTERRPSIITQATISTVDKWLSITSDTDTNEWKSSGIADAASALGDAIEDVVNTGDTSWDSLSGREQQEIMQVMEKITEVIQTATQRIKDKLLKEQFEQRKEEIREWTRQISA